MQVCTQSAQVDLRLQLWSYLPAVGFKLILSIAGQDIWAAAAACGSRRQCKPSELP